MQKRKAGILLHPSSFPGPWGVGDLGDEATTFLRWLEHAGQTLWQILPLGPTGMGNSPYGALSSFAGNPLLVSPKRLADDGLVDTADLAHPPHLSADHVDFSRAALIKEKFLRFAWKRFWQQSRPELRSSFEEFRADEETNAWLPDWCLFRALKDKFAGSEWSAWDHDLATREPLALDRARNELRDEIEYHAFVQWIFFKQWRVLHQEARRHGISIIGDIPIYVAYDSADVWANQNLFYLSHGGLPTIVAGVPPDYFSKTGQRWGNPLYRWDVMKDDGFSWYIARIKANLRLVDWLRIDHFRGFAGYWEIPASEETAVNGHWRKGPGRKLFDALRAKLGDLPLIAEDLGVITADVERLLHATKLPGMKVLQFAFGETNGTHAPHRCPHECIVYTGTHDNDTTLGWFRSAPDWERRRALDYLGGDDQQMNWTLIRAAMTSVAQWAVVPAQDIFSLGAEARMNTPGKATGNWGWRARQSQFTEEIVQRLRFLTELGGRLREQFVAPAPDV